MFNIIIMADLPAALMGWVPLAWLLHMIGKPVAISHKGPDRRDQCDWIRQPASVARSRLGMMVGPLGVR
jgi:hypothetical protein